MENEFTIPENAETKSAPFALFAKANIKGERTRAGIFAVLGNRDNAGDRTQPGAFAKTWKEGKKNIVHLWDHGESDLAIPTASIDDLYEISKNDLPDEVLAHSPDAIGGAVVVRTYVKSQWGDHFLAAVDSGAIKQMSFAYAIPKGKDEVIQEQYKGQLVNTRLLKEVKQYDTSDVRWGCNGATIAQIKSLFRRPITEFDAMVKAIREMDEAKRADLLALLAPAKAVEPEHDFSFKLAFARLQSLHATQPSRV
jgi:phage head maturation protease